MQRDARLGGSSERQPGVARAFERGAVDDGEPDGLELLREPVSRRADEEERGGERRRRREPRRRGDGGDRDGPVGRGRGMDLLEPAARAVECRPRRLLGGDVDAEAVPLERAGAAGDPLGRPREEAEPQLRHREALAEAADHDHVVAEPEGRGERRAVPQRRLVGLVGDDDEPVPLRDGDDGGHVVPRGHVAGRVARVAEQQRLRPRPDRALDRLGIPAPAVRLGAVDVDGDAAGRPDRPAEEEGRRRHDDLVARLEQRPEADAERLHGAVRDEDLRLGVDAPVVVRSSSAASACRNEPSPFTGGVFIRRASTAATASTTWSGSAGAPVPCNGTASIPGGSAPRRRSSAS